MVPQRERRPFVPKGEPEKSSGSRNSRQGTAGRAARRSASQVIPDRVASRMARRIALATGVPTVMGMAVFVGSYLLVSRHLLDVPPSATLLASGACFLLGLVGLSYGVLSASWEEEPGSLLGIEQIGLNLGRVRASIQAMRRGSREDGAA